jgi:addiction module RelB/DinJ family antitoxin
MNDAVINIKVNKTLKLEAQQLAEELGFSLSSLIIACLRQIVRTRAVSFDASEEPSEYMVKMLEKSKENIKKGYVSPAFDNMDDAVKWLNNPRKKYVGKIQ